MSFSSLSDFIFDFESIRRPVAPELTLWEDKPESFVIN
jgi:hypothetical protein